MNMPKLRPLPIQTKHRPLWVRLWRWLTSIREWEVIEDWYFTLPDGSGIVIPKGFIFDGASIPRPLWAILSPTGLLFIPSLVHDFAYRYDYLWGETQTNGFMHCWKGVGRAHWDKLFRDMCIQVNGLAYIDRIAWAMIYLFGWIAWQNHRNRRPTHLPPTIR